MDDALLTWLRAQINKDGLKYREAVRDDDDYMIGYADGCITTYVQVGTHLDSTVGEQLIKAGVLARGAVDD